MNPFILMILFSGLLHAQTDELENESFRTKKNTFLNERARLMKAHEDYWAARKEVQAYDAVMLAKEKRILSTQVKMANVNQAIYSQDHSRKDKLASELEKETIFTKTAKGYTVVDANDDEQFSRPAEGAKELCLTDKSKCFPFKVEEGKRVLTLSKADKVQELKDLKVAKKVLEKQLVLESSEKNMMVRNRSKILKKEAKVEQIFDVNKEKFVNLLKDDEGGMDEAFVDKMLKDSDKAKIFGDSDLDPDSADSKAKAIDALSNKYFSKNSYANIKGKAADYKVLDEKYLAAHQDVTGLKEKYKLNSSILGLVEAPVEIASESKAKIVVASKVAPPEFIWGDPNAEIAIEEKPIKIAMPKVILGDPDEVLDLSGLEPKEEAKTTFTPEQIACITEDPSCKTNKEKEDKEASTTAATSEPIPAVIPPFSAEISGLCTELGDDGLPLAECPADVQKEEQVKTSDKEGVEALCKKEAIAKIIELFKDDKQNILGKQFNLTAMKTALFMKKVAAPSSVSSSLEEIVNKNQATIASDKNIEALKKAYAKHGLDKAGAGVDQTIEKMKNGKFNYFSTASRMSNDEASQMLLILTKSESPIKFGMEDAAVTWAFGEMAKVQRKSLNGQITAKDSVELNKLSLSVQVNKLISSTVAGGTNMSVEKLENSSQKLEKEISDAVKVAVKSVSESCQNTLGEDCLIANDLKHDALAEMMKTILNHQETKMDDKQLSQFHMKVDGFIGKASKEDLAELGKMKLKKKIVLASPVDNTKVLETVGKATIGSGRAVANVGGTCIVAKTTEEEAFVNQEMCGDQPVD